MPWAGFLKCLNISIRVFIALPPRFVFTPSITFNSIHIPLHTLVIKAPLLQHIKTIHWTLLSNIKPAASSIAMFIVTTTTTRQSNTCINQRQDLSDESDITLVSKGVWSQRGVVWDVGNGVALGEICIIDHAVETVLTHLGPTVGGIFYSQFATAANILHSFA